MRLLQDQFQKFIFMSIYYTETDIYIYIPDI